VLRKPVGKKILIDCRFDRKSEENHNRKLIHMYTDPIADYLTRVRNAVAANHRLLKFLLLI
jgi:small subunit ribosomal protein S8